MIPYGLPYLQQYGVLFDDQFEDITPYLDGRIYLGLSQLKRGKGSVPKAKIAFGVTQNYKYKLDTTLLSEMTKCTNSEYYSDIDKFQYILPKKDYIIYSNHEELNTPLLKSSTMFNLHINHKLINEDLFNQPKMLFGNDAVDHFPVKTIEIEVHKKATHLETTISIKCKNENTNSIETILNYIEILGNKEEI